MAPDATDAKRISLLFSFGVATPKDVIAWSDSQIEAIADPPSVLLELSSTLPSNTGDIITHLNVLAREGDFWKAFRASMARLYKYVKAHPDEAERIANELYRTVVLSYSNDVPKEFKFIYHFDDAFSLARAGIYSDSKSVYYDFLAELSRFKDESNAPS